MVREKIQNGQMGIKGLKARMRREWARKAGEGRRQATEFQEAAYCPFSVVQGAARRKNGLCERSARGDWDPREGEQLFRPNPNGAADRNTTLRWLLIGIEVVFCRQTLSRFHN